MRSLVIKYLILLGITLGFFANAIACGTAMYQVSMERDTDHRHPENPASKDPKSATFGLHSPKGWDKLPIHFKFGQSVTEPQKKAILAAMAKWEWAVGKKLFLNQGIQAGVDGDTFGQLYDSLEDEINGDYLNFEWGKTGKPEQVLATTIWDNSEDGSMITKADIHFNAEFYVLGDSFKDKAQDRKEVVDMESLALHELGHLLGLAHVAQDSDPYSIMNPSLYIGEGLAAREFSEGDIKRIQSLYGCEAVACDIDALIKEQAALKIPNSAKKPRSTRAKDPQAASPTPDLDPKP